MAQPKRWVLFLFILVVVLAGIRLIIIVPMLEPDYISSFHIGAVPLNDAFRWVDWTRGFLEGRPLVCRTFFPLVMAPSFLIFGDNVAAHVAVLSLFNILAVAGAFFILKDIRNNLFIVSFLALVSVWRITMLPRIMTENLAIPVLIVGAALVIRGLFLGKARRLLEGLFLIALAQLIRPWNFLCFLILPLFPFAYRGISKKALKAAVAMFAVMCIAVSLHFILEGLFVKKDFSTGTPVAFTFYGQTVGGQGCNAWILEQELRTAYSARVPTKEMERLVYSKIWENIKERPGDLMRGFLSGYGWLLTRIPRFYSGSEIGSPWYLLLIFFLYFLYLFDRRPLAPVGYALTALCGGLFVWKQPVFLTALLVIGLFYVFIFCEKRFKAFISVVLFDIFVTILIFGGSGLESYGLPLILLLFALTSAAFAGVAGVRSQHSTNTEPDALIDIRLRDFTGVVLVYAVLLVSLVAIPAGARAAYGRRGKDITVPLSKEFIAGSLGLKKLPLSEDDIHRLVHLWPYPSFEKANGQFVFVKTRYRSFAALEFEKNKGLDLSELQILTGFWPYADFSFKRVVFAEYYIMPFMTKEYLSSFDGNEIVLVGTIIGKPRAKFYFRGYAVLVNYIGYIDDNGELAWFHLLKGAIP